MRTHRTLGIAILVGVALLVLAVDQASKAWIVATLLLKGMLPLVEGIARFRYTQNTGAAFGIFQGGSALLSIAAVVVIIGIVLSAQKVSGGSRLSIFALGLVLGGALGNVVDRIRLGYVVDFIEVYGLSAKIGDTVYTFPVFNVADSAITVGVLLLMATLLFGSRSQVAEKRHSRSEGEEAAAPLL